MFDLSAYLETQRQLVDRVLDERLPPESTRPATLHRAMRYSVFGEAKRIRPILCLAASDAAGGARASALVPAAAIELLHTYTLIHDDLPAMDNDDLRRGRPTCHVAFDEATAILAGDALLTLAFEWLAACAAPTPYRPNELALELARAAGSQGVIGGQSEDLAAEGREPTAELVDYIHHNKTGALIRASVRIGAITAGADRERLDALTCYSECAGLAFQIADDVLNATASAEVLGKGAGTDQQRGKVTYVALHGLDGARARSAELIQAARSALAPFGEKAAPLGEIASYIIQRSR